MTIIVEDGSGIFEANAYVGPGYVRAYLSKRNRASKWISADRAEQEAALIATTDYIDRRFGKIFLGQKEYSNLSVSASNILIFYTNALDGDKITIDSVTYTFRDTPTQTNDIQIGAASEDTAGALVDAMAGIGSQPHPTVSGSVLTGSDAVFMQARTAGPLAAPIQTLSTSANLVWDLPELTGGAINVSQYLEFPRSNLFLPSGERVVGIPEGLKMAVAEYASRAIEEDLMPDPEVDPHGASLARIYDKIGPIETERRFVFSSETDIFKRFPSADRLISPYLANYGKVYR